MTTLLDILQRDDIRELRQSVYDAYQEMVDTQRHVAGVRRVDANRATAHPERYMDHEPYGEHMTEDAQDAYRDAQARYYGAINAACAESGLPPYHQMAGPESWGLLSVADAAAELGISPATIRVQIHNGRIEATRVGRDNYISRTEIERYEREHRREKPYPAM